MDAVLMYALILSVYVINCIVIKLIYDFVFFNIYISNIRLHFISFLFIFVTKTNCINTLLFDYLRNIQFIYICRKAYSFITVI